MKTTFTTVAIIALTFANSYATEVQLTSNTIDPSLSKLAKQTSTTLTRDQIKEVFEWNVTTNQSNYSGTSNSLKEAQKMIALAAMGEIILELKIESFFQVKDEFTFSKMQLFFWEVETSTGKAKGFSNSECQAKRMIELVSTGAILNFKIIQSGDFQK